MIGKAIRHSSLSFWKTNNNHINHYRAISVWRMEQALTSFHLLAFGRARRRFQQFWRGRWDSVTRMKQVGGWGGAGQVESSGAGQVESSVLWASGLLERSLFGGGGATSSRGRLSQGRLSHQLGSLGGGKIQSDLNSAKHIFRWVFCGTRQSSCSK